MSLNKQRQLEITEKTVAKMDGSTSNDRDFTAEIDEIYNHIENGTITKPIFKSFIDKVYTQINHYKEIAAPKKAPIIKPIPLTDSTAQIEAATLVTSLTDIHGRCPKSKLLVEFYGEFLAFITPSKRDCTNLKAIIEYKLIERIIAVPLKNDDTLFYIKLSKKIPLKFRKSSIDCFSVTFEDLSGYEDCTEDIDICNLNTNLPSKLNGTKESLFCRVMTDLTQNNINRHDKHLFKTVNDSKKTVFYIDASMKFNKVSVYPLRCGLFIAPKPLRFIPQNKIKYYEYTRSGSGLRYFDIDIVLFEDEEDAKQSKTEKKKKKQNVIALSMISKKETSAIDYYFNKMNIELKREGISPKRNNNKNKEEKDNADTKSVSSMDQDINELSDSDDEEYKVEDDNYEYSDSNASDDDDEDDDIDMKRVNDGVKNVEMGSDDDDEEEDDLIIDDKETSNSPLISPRRAKKKNTNRKRKRSESEYDDSNDSRKRPRWGFGRKTTNYGNGKIVSKEITKKKSPKKKNKSPNMDAKCVDCGKEFKNRMALGGHRASKHPKHPKRNTTL